jgi:hypothetical protein
MRHAPIDGLRVGASVLRASFDEYLNLSPALTGALITLGLAQAGFNGRPRDPSDPAGGKCGASERFVREVIRKTPAQLKSYWNQQIFSGSGVPPPDAESSAAMIAYVVDHPGAIGYLPASVDPGGARVVRLK